MYLKNKKLSISRILCFLPIFYGGMTLKCQAMDFLSAAYKVGGYVVGAAQGLVNYLEIPKDPQEEFKEKITRLDIQGAENIFQKEIRELEASTPLQKSSLGNDDFIFYHNKEAAISLYNRMVIAAVTVDYVRLCLGSINNVLEMLDHKINQPQYLPLKGELEELKKLTAVNFKVNLGAMLYARYRYIRGGGLGERGTISYSSKTPRLDLWGVKTLPSPDYTSYKDKIKFEGKEDRMEIKNFLSMYSQYEITLELLSKTESALLTSGEEKGIDYYADPETLSKVFGRNIKLTPINLYSEIFEINYNIQEEWEEESRVPEVKGEEVVETPVKATPIDIAPRKTSKNHSGSASSSGSTTSASSKTSHESLVLPQMKKKGTINSNSLLLGRPPKGNQNKSQLTAEVLSNISKTHESDLSGDEAHEDDLTED